MYFIFLRFLFHNGFSLGPCNRKVKDLALDVFTGGNCEAVKTVLYKTYIREKIRYHKDALDH